MATTGAGGAGFLAGLTAALACVLFVVVMAQVQQSQELLHVARQLRSSSGPSPAQRVVGGRRAVVLPVPFTAHK